MTLKNSDVYILPEISFIGGTDKVLTFTTYTEDNITLLTLYGIEIEWILTYYEYKEQVVLRKTGVPININNFTVTLNYDDTISLSGKFIQQPIITDFTGNIFRPAQGTVLILPAFPSV